MQNTQVLKGACGKSLDLGIQGHHDPYNSLVDAIE